MMAPLLNVTVLRVLRCLERDGVLIHDLEQHSPDLAVLTRFGVRRVG